VCDVHDAGRGDIRNSRMGAIIGREFDTFGALWADAVDDIDASEVIV